MTSPPSTRFSLIGRLHDAADVDAWNEFVETYQPMILRIAEKRGLQYADAAEVAQDVLRRVSSSIEIWNPDQKRGSFRGWLFTITRNITIDRLRHNNHLRRTSEQLDSSFDISQIPEPTDYESQEFRLEYEREVFNWAAIQAQAMFKPQNWEAFRLTTIEDLPIKSVTRQLSMTQGQVYVARSRIMARISTLIRQRLSEAMGVARK